MIRHEPSNSAGQRSPDPDADTAHGAFDPNFVCPRDRHALAPQAGALRCVLCAAIYPVVDGTPVFICDERSVFAQLDYRKPDHERTEARRATADAAGTSRLLNGLRRLDQRIAGWLVRSSASSLKRPFYGDAVSLALRHSGKERLRVLVIGSGEQPYRHPQADVVCTDVAFGPDVRAIADAHDLPFPDGSFDLAVAVAVLEHVADPQRCVDELWRVLAETGFVFAVTPFLEPVHLGAYDFTRFTPLGHRRLFRRFDTLEAGAAMGAGSMLAFALTGVLLSVSRRRMYRNLANLAALFLTLPLRRLDRWFNTEVSLDNAAACYFLGARRNVPVPDRTLIREYRGGFSNPAQ